MFTHSARWYDALYSFKNYEAEAQEIIRIINNELPEAKTLLDVGCGTAEHHKYLTSEYEVDGIDLNETFIHISREKNPDGQYHTADMINFKLGKTYDVIACLFSSIGYVKTLSNLNKTFKCFRKHLKHEGIILIEPWFTPDTWDPDPKAKMLTAVTPAESICRMHTTRKKDNLAILEFHYLIGTSSRIEYFTEEHQLGLFTVEKMLQSFKRAGLNASYEQGGITGRGLYCAKIAGVHEFPDRK